MKYSHADIADNESIQDYTAYRYKTLSNIIEYGADHAKPIEANPEHFIRYPFMRNPYAFKVCRIEPENNIHVVLAAFSDQLKMPVVIVGNWNNSEYGRELKKKYGTNSHIILLDPIYEQDKLNLLRSNASVYFHGHSAGGTNPALVEAMYLGLPVITFRVSYNITTTENKAWYFTTEADIRQLIEEMTDAGLKENAGDMKEIANRRYTWEIIAGKYMHLVERVMSTSGKVEVLPASGKLDMKKLVDMEIGHLGYHSFFYEKR